MKITFYGHFGTSNTGNESTLLAAVSYLRGRHPDWQFACACTDPEAVAERLGIDTFPISTRSVRLWNRRISLGGRARSAVVGITEEFKQWIAAFRALAGTDLLVVPGTGLLTDAFGLSGWGPYNLFKWSSMARLRGCRVRFLSVGAGPLYTRRGRRLVRYALALADYRSYRDAPSLELTRQIGFRGARDRVRPDLAFSLPPDLLPAPADAPRERRVVGLGLMTYFERYSAADPKPETYPAYLDSMVDATQWLLEHDYDVRLLVGDEDPVIEQFRSLLRSRLGSAADERVLDRPMRTVDEVLRQLAATDVVIATRFHNIVLALRLNKPVVAISHHEKCSSVMAEIGLSEFCHDIHEMDATKLLAQFQKLESVSEVVQRAVARKVEEFRTSLEEQYALLVGDLYAHGDDVP